MNSPSGFREVGHIADWEIEVWGETLDDIFIQAVNGIYTLIEVETEESVRERYEFQLEAQDNESLLVRFLSEILYLIEDSGKILEEIRVVVQSDWLLAGGMLVPIKRIEKTIKAVTWHHLQIKNTKPGYSVRIVFDV